MQAQVKLLCKDDYNAIFGKRIFDELYSHKPIDFSTIATSNATLRSDPREGCLVENHRLEFCPIIGLVGMPGNVKAPRPPLHHLGLYYVQVAICELQQRTINQLNAFSTPHLHILTQLIKILQDSQPIEFLRVAIDTGRIGTETYWVDSRLRKLSNASR